MKQSILIFFLIGLVSAEITAAPHIVDPPIFYSKPVWIFPAQLYNSDCTSSFTFFTIESNNDYTYNAEKSILMQDNYQTSSSNNEIRMKAGEVIVFKPGTAIKQGSVYLARIEPCVPCPMNFSYPKFITPNGDGFNDVFRITTAHFSPIYIFDRYGKVLKVLQNPDEFWDGSYNSENIFANDYWFKTDYIDCNGIKKEVKSHFTLKR